MRILFLTHPYPNYVPDLLLHGLRKLIGPDVVDFPRKDCLYEGILGLGICPDDQRCPNWFPQDYGTIDRDDIYRKATNRYFDYVISDIRALSFLQNHFNPLPEKLVIIDGEDFPQKIELGPYVICRRETDGSDFSIPLPMALPEEILHWISSYDHYPKTFSVGFLGSTNDGARRRIAEAIAENFPDALLKTSEVPTTDNPKPSERLGRAAYYGGLQHCKIVLSLPGAGYDTFRFWENAACNAVHLAQRLPLFIPDDFLEANHIFRFSDIGELISQVDKILQKPASHAEIIAQGRYHLARYHVTTARARYFIDRLKQAFCC